MEEKSSLKCQVKREENLQSNIHRFQRYICQQFPSLYWWLTLQFEIVWETLLLSVLTEMTHVMWKQTSRSKCRWHTFFWYDTDISEFDSADISDYICEKSVSCQKNDGNGQARPSFFWYDNDKDLLRSVFSWCAVMRVKSGKLSWRWRLYQSRLGLSAGMYHLYKCLLR